MGDAIKQAAMNSGSALAEQIKAQGPDVLKGVQEKALTMANDPEVQKKAKEYAASRAGPYRSSSLGVSDFDHVDGEQRSDGNQPVELAEPHHLRYLRLPAALRGLDGSLRDAPRLDGKSQLPEVVPGVVISQVQLPHGRAGPRPLLYLPGLALGRLRLPHGPPGPRGDSSDGVHRHSSRYDALWHWARSSGVADAHVHRARAATLASVALGGHAPPSSWYKMKPMYPPSIFWYFWHRFSSFQPLSMQYSNSAFKNCSIPDNLICKLE